MKDDLKNVIITFSLIGLAYTQGSLMYQKKLLNDYILSKEVLPEVSLNINDSQNQVSGPGLVVVESSTTIATVKPVVKKITPQTPSNSAAIKATNDAELAKVKAQLIAQQQAQAAADAEAAAQATYQSRRSSAS